MIADLSENFGPFMANRALLSMALAAFRAMGLSSWKVDAGDLKLVGTTCGDLSAALVCSEDMWPLFHKFPTVEDLPEGCGIGPMTAEKIMRKWLAQSS